MLLTILSSLLPCISNLIFSLAIFFKRDIIRYINKYKCMAMRPVYFGTQAFSMYGGDGYEVGV